VLVVRIIRWIEWFGFSYGCIAAVASAFFEIKCWLGYQLPDSPTMFQWIFTLHFILLFLVCSPSILPRRPVLKPTGRRVVAARLVLAISGAQVVGIVVWIAIATRLQRVNDDLLVYIMTVGFSSVLLLISITIVCGWALSWPTIFSSYNQRLPRQGSI
jgi:hypothetical protein